MNKLTKLLILSSIASATLFANDNLVIDFKKKRLSQNPNVKANNIKVFYKKELEIKGWSAYVLDFDAVIQDKNMRIKDTLFSDGKVVATDLFDITTSKSIKPSIVPNLTDKYYQKSKLIAGSDKAKNKVVLFSDPLCPFCMQYVPEVIEFANKNSDNIALYYYAFPLTQIHPASTTLSKLIDIAKIKTGQDAVLKAYKVDWNKHFTPSTTDDKTILEAFNKELQTNIKLDDLNKKDVLNNLEKEISFGDDLLIGGTPTIYINGEVDPTKELYKSLIKK